MLILTNLYIFLLATILALLEIQIEGPNGWAKNLPTWRPHISKWYSRLWKSMMSGKELTGYHLLMFGFVFLIFQFPFFLGAPLNLTNWLKDFSLYMLFIPMWDFLWFVLNPFYPLKNFQKDNIVHKRWLFGMPVDYYFSLGISLVIALLGEFIFNLPGLFSWWLINIGLFILETILIIIFSFIVLNIDNWKIN